MLPLFWVHLLWSTVCTLPTTLLALVAGACYYQTISKGPTLPCGCAQKASGSETGLCVPQWSPTQAPGPLPENTHDMLFTAHRPIWVVFLIGFQPLNRTSSTLLREGEGGVIRIKCCFIIVAHLYQVNTALRFFFEKAVCPNHCRFTVLEKSV